MEAVKNHGVVIGSWLITKRLSRCHPWGGFGYDPVPEKNNNVNYHS
jgi:putative component of membrane protein insertase Oxa1/YidC/SpoIIIJ protein YidD